MGKQEPENKKQIINGIKFIVAVAVIVVGYVITTSLTKNSERNELVSKIPSMEKAIEVNTNAIEGCKSSQSSTDNKIDKLIIYFSVKDPEFNNIINSNK